METIFCLSLSLHFDSQDSTADTHSEDQMLVLNRKKFF